MEECFFVFFESSYVDKREWIPERVWLSISGRYPGFHEWLNWRGGHVEPCNITDVELDRRSRCISENTRGLVVQSVNESSWGPGTGMFGYTPCFFSLFISLSSLISFREFFFLAGPETGAAKHAAPFDLTLKTFNMHLIHLSRISFERPCFKPPYFAIDNLYAIPEKSDINGSLTGH